MDDDAEAALQEVLKINPNTINVFNSLGIIHRRQGRYDKALVQYQKAMKVNPDDENILYNLGRAHYDMGPVRGGRRGAGNGPQDEPGLQGGGRPHPQHPTPRQVTTPLAGYSLCTPARPGVVFTHAPPRAPAGSKLATNRYKYPIIFQPSIWHALCSSLRPSGDPKQRSGFLEVII